MIYLIHFNGESEASFWSILVEFQADFTSTILVDFGQLFQPNNNQILVDFLKLFLINYFKFVTKNCNQISRHFRVTFWLIIQSNHNQISGCFQVKFRSIIRCNFNQISAPIFSWIFGGFQPFFCFLFFVFCLFFLVNFPPKISSKFLIIFQLIFQSNFNLFRRLIFPVDFAAEGQLEDVSGWTFKKQKGKKHLRKKINKK